MRKSWRRLSLVGLIAPMIMILAVPPQPATAADPPFAVTITSPPPITTFRTSAQYTMQVNRAGTYDLTWSMSGPGTPPSGSVTGGTIEPDGGLAPIIIDGADVVDGTYSLQGQLVVHSETGETSNLDLFWTDAQDLYVDETPPTVTNVTQTRTTIYPRVNTKEFPGRVGVRFYGPNPYDFNNGLYVKSGDTTVTKWGTTSPGESSIGFTWPGYIGSRLAPPGVYRLVVADAVGNESALEGRVTVSSLHRVMWTRTVKAAPTLVDKYVGRCSTLRRPAAGRGWTGSLGFYANTRCGANTVKASLVSTVHGIRVPAAPGYGYVRVNPYGGGAKARPGSRAVIRYLDNHSQWRHESVMSGRLGSHHGYLVLDPENYLFGRNLYWGTYTGFGHKYDIREFLVKVELYKY